MKKQDETIREMKEQLTEFNEKPWKWKHQDQTAFNDKNRNTLREETFAGRSFRGTKKTQSIGN